jgi:V/A-type H+-transporting ATPase subunit A
MPVASREASVYTAVTLAEYYRQMGLNVLMLADSTSRWAQAMREMSGRLEEIPGEEAFPAYLESYIAAFYERAGYVRLPDGTTGSVTIGGTVSPAGGNFEEPVTQATLKVVGAFHGLSRERSDARKYPAIDPLISWSKYQSVIERNKSDYFKNLLHYGSEVDSMMKVIGEEGTTLSDYITYLKSSMLDSVYLQQNSFDPVEANCSTARQRYVSDKLIRIIASDYSLESKDDARVYFNRMRQRFIDWNYTEFESEDFSKAESEIDALYAEGNGTLTQAATDLLKEGV